MSRDAGASTLHPALNARLCMKALHPAAATAPVASSCVRRNVDPTVGPDQRQSYVLALDNWQTHPSPIVYPRHTFSLLMAAGWCFRMDSHCLQPVPITCEKKRDKETGKC